MNIVATAVSGISAFIVALALGLFNNTPFPLVLIRSVLSGIAISAVYTMIMFVINRYLPELSASYQKSSDDDVNHDNRVNIVIPVDEESLPDVQTSGADSSYGAVDMSSGSSEGSAMNDGGRKSHVVKKAEPFVQENPEILAKMIRTSLSKDDN